MNDPIVEFSLKPLTLMLLLQPSTWTSLVSEAVTVTPVEVTVVLVVPQVLVSLSLLVQATVLPQFELLYCVQGAPALDAPFVAEPRLSQALTPIWL